MAEKYLTIDGLIFLITQLKGEFVEQVEGKGLSTNDLTDELKQKILNAGDSSFTGNYEDLTNKPFIPIKVSDLTNDKGFQTAAEVATAIAGAGHLVRIIVEALPNVSSADTHAIYMLKNAESGENRFTEWMVINGNWELIGSSEVDLSDYLKTTDIVAITNTEIDDIINTVFA